MSSGRRQWLRAEDIDARAGTASMEALVETLRWVREFLGRPHPDLGRSGPVCPFIPGALKRSSLYFAISDADDRGTVTRVVDSALADFLDLQPTEHPDAAFKAILLVFPKVSAESASDVVDGVQRERKPEFVAKHLMIGQFHAQNQSQGNHNRAFRPLRSPIPLLAVRFMVFEDLPFLTADEYGPLERLDFLYQYLEKLKQEPTAPRREKHISGVIEALQSLIREVRN